MVIIDSMVKVILVAKSPRVSTWYLEIAIQTDLLTGVGRVKKC